jgi:PmbA protein
MINDALEQVIALAKQGGATAAEAYGSDDRATELTVRQGERESIIKSQTQTLTLRLWLGMNVVSLTSSDLAKPALASLVEEALLLAKQVTPDPLAYLAEDDLLAKNPPNLQLADTKNPDIAELLETAQIMEAKALGHAGVVMSEGADVSASWHYRSLLTSSGFHGHYNVSHFARSLSVVAERNGEKERDYAFSQSRFYSDLMDAETLGTEAALRSVSRLGAKTIATKSMPVVWDWRTARQFLGYFLSAINGASVARGGSFLQKFLGEKIFPEQISIYQDPHLAKGLASCPFDGEGVRNSRLDLVKDGVLKNWLLDTRSAKQLGLKTNGSAVRASGLPSPGASNVFLAPGKITEQELLADINEGFYLTETIGMGLNLVTGDLSLGAAGYLIEKGERTIPVHGITIAGSLIDLFANLTPANNLRYDSSFVLPTIRTDGLMIAGA